MTLRGRRRNAAALLFAGVAALAAAPAHASRHCDAERPLSAGQKDRLFRFGAVIKSELDRSGASLALIARSGLDLSRFQVRYSHAGVSLKASPETPWAVRQLYYACEEGRPLLFDQGISAFLMGTDEPSLGFVSVVFLPRAAADDLERAALDKRQVLQLLGPTYSANAYPFALDYQNCNQWVIELLAAAWGGFEGGSPTRAQAQSWLQAQAYAPTVFSVAAPLVWLSAAVPWLHLDDHPAGDLDQHTFRVSMPAAIEAFVQRQVPGATRVEFCHDGRRVVVRRGWAPIADGCVAGAGDSVIPFD